VFYSNLKFVNPQTGGEETFPLAVNQSGSGKPYSNTPGAPGMLYMNMDNGDLYVCKTVDQDTGLCTWVKIWNEQWNEKEQDPTVFDWARREIFSKEDFVDPAGRNGIMYSGGTEYYRYLAAEQNFEWINPIPAKGAVTVTFRAFCQYDNRKKSALYAVYADGTEAEMTYIPEQKTTFVSDSSKVLLKIRGSGDLNDWMLLDMSVMSVRVGYNKGLPAANTEFTGGIKADPVTSEDTQPVRIGEDGKLYTAKTGNGTSVPADRTCGLIFPAEITGSAANTINVPVSLISLPLSSYTPGNGDMVLTADNCLYKITGFSVGEETEYIGKLIRYFGSEHSLNTGAELFDKADMPLDTQSFVIVDGVEYYRYHAGTDYGFTWNNPRPQKGAVTITARGVSQYGGTGGTRLKTIYDDGTNGPDVYIVVGGESQTATVTTDENKTLSKITGNYDLENWVLLDMSVMSVKADYLVQEKYTLPTATADALGGIKADPKTAADTQPVRIGEDGKLYTAPGGDSPGNTSENGWVKLGDITVADAYEYTMLSCESGVITIDTNAENYSYLTTGEKIFFVLVPLDVTTKEDAVLRKLAVKDATAGTFDMYNADGNALATESYDVSKYKITAKNVSKVAFDNVPDMDNYKLRLTAPIIHSRGSRPYIYSSMSGLDLDYSMTVNITGGVIFEIETMQYPYDENYFYKKTTIYSGKLNSTTYGHSAISMGASGAGKSKPNNGKIEFNSANMVFVNGLRFELWGANDD